MVTYDNLKSRPLQPFDTKGCRTSDNIYYVNMSKSRYNQVVTI